jgi:non-specific serine/threonine protein kinase/serine/threonine-protein kinase
VADFLVSLFRAATPGTRKASDISARELLDEGAKRLRLELTDQPEVRARLQDEIGNVCRSLGLYEQARPLLNDALQTRRALFAADSIEVGESLGSLGALELETGHLQAAEPLLREAVQILQAAGGERLARSRNPVELAAVVGNLGRRAEAEELLKETIRVREAAFGPDAEPVAGPLNNLGNLYYDMRRFDEAARAHERALAIRERVLGPDHVYVAQSLNNLGNVRNEQGRPGEAEALQQRALEIKRKALAPDHQELGVSEHNLGDIAFKQGHIDAADARYRAARAIFEKTLAAEHPYLAYSDQALANVARERGQVAAAEALYKRALQSLERSFGRDNAAVQDVKRDYARLLRSQHREPEARALEAGQGVGMR